MKLSSLPVIQLPIVDVSTDPLDLLVTGLALRMKQLARTSPKFIELVHDREFRIQIGTDLGLARQIIVVNRGKLIQLQVVLKKLILFCNLLQVSRA